MPTDASADVRDVYHSQNNIGEKFSDSTKPTLEQTIANIKSGALSPDDLPPIRVVSVDGTLTTLDNRRLYVYKQALKGKQDQTIKFKLVQMDEPADPVNHPHGRTVREDLERKMVNNPDNPLQSIRIRDGLAHFVPRTGPNGGLHIYTKTGDKVYLSQMSPAQLKQLIKDHPNLKRSVKAFLKIKKTIKEKEVKEQKAKAEKAKSTADSAQSQASRHESKAASHGSNASTHNSRASSHQSAASSARSSASGVHGGGGGGGGGGRGGGMGGGMGGGGGGYHHRHSHPLQHLTHQMRNMSMGHHYGVPRHSMTPSFSSPSPRVHMNGTRGSSSWDHFRTNVWQGGSRSAMSAAYKSWKNG